MKKFRLTGDFKKEPSIEVFGNDGNVSYSLDRLLSIPTREKYVILNKDSTRIGEIKKQRYSFGFVDLPTIVIAMDGYKAVVIRKEIVQFEMHYTINGEKLSVVGDFLGATFKVMQAGTILADVEVSKAEGFVFEITVHEDSLADLIIGFIIGLDYLYQYEAATIVL